jgi:hypothetical protein
LRPAEGENDADMGRRHAEVYRTTALRQKRPFP